MLNHCYELLAACMRAAEDVSPEMKVGRIRGAAALLCCNDGMQAGLNAGGTKGPGYRRSGWVGARLAWLHALLQAARPSLAEPRDSRPLFLLHLPCPLAQDVYDRLRSSKNALSSLLGKRVSAAATAPLAPPSRKGRALRA